jgi:CheY-like chemotaxis protein
LRPGLQVNHFHPHLMILDIMMPDIKGNEVCRKIKSNEDTNQTKIIVLSAYLDEEKFKEMKSTVPMSAFPSRCPCPSSRRKSPGCWTLNSDPNRVSAINKEA